MVSKETFCGKPFSGLFLSPDGGIKYCCALNENLGNINEQTIDEILNNDLSKDIREKILNNEWHDACRYCKNVEDRGGESERITTLDKMEDFKDSNYKLEQIDLRWSNTCNLSCTYCNSMFSSKWAAIFNEKINQNKSNTEESLIQYIIDNNETLSTVLLLGGEPLLQKQNEKLISNINCDITILTNLSVVLNDNKIYNNLIEKDNVKWNVSFETIGDKFEYVRRGADWNVFKSNLYELFNRTGRKIGAQPVYCLYSALNLSEYYDFINECGFFDNVFWQVLNHPKNLDIFNYPKNVKLLAIQEIDKCVDKHRNFDMSTLLNIKSELINKMDEYDRKTVKNLDSFLFNLENKQLKNDNLKFNNIFGTIYQEIKKSNG
jgi:radical SAM protein with 4Fe4S-binding SPASM domain